jgi:hypothetical protein
MARKPKITLREDEGTKAAYHKGKYVARVYPHTMVPPEAQTGHVYVVEMRGYPGFGGDTLKEVRDEIAARVGRRNPDDDDWIDDVEVDYEAWGPADDLDEAESALRIAASNGFVQMAEWIYSESVDFGPEEDEWIKTSEELDLPTLMDLSEPHRGTYGGDEGASLEDLRDMTDAERQAAIVSAAISYLGYYAPNEEIVDGILED